MDLRSALFAAILTASLFAGTSARAEPVNLSCTHDRSEDQTGRVTFDESARTAGFTRGNGVPPTSSATFTDSEIAWGYKDPSGFGGHISFTLDRTTGALTMMFDGSKGQHESWHCAVATKKF